MNTALWIGQGFLAFTFLYSGISKSTRSERWLVEHGQTGVEGLPPGLIRFIGISELLGVLGLLLPIPAGTLPVLTPMAALCLALIMIPAAIIHYRRNEMQSMVLNLLILSVAVFVASGRFREFLG